MISTTTIKSDMDIEIIIRPKESGLATGHIHEPKLKLSIRQDGVTLSAESYAKLVDFMKNFEWKAC